VSSLVHGTTATIIMMMPISLLLSWKTFFMLGPATAFYTAPYISQGKLRLSTTETNSAEWEDPPDCDGGVYGRQEYWNNAYHLASQVGGVSDDPVSSSPSFSWYASWCDLAPFFTEVAPALSVSVLVPGVGTGNSPHKALITTIGFVNDFFSPIT